MRTPTLLRVRDWRIAIRTSESNVVLGDRLPRTAAAAGRVPRGNRPRAARADQPFGRELDRPEFLRGDERAFVREDVVHFARDPPDRFVIVAHVTSLRSDWRRLPSPS